MVRSLAGRTFQLRLISPPRSWPLPQVLCPSMTMVAVCNAVKTVGATPIYVDCGKGKINPGVQEYLARASPKVSEA